MSLMSENTQLQSNSAEVKTQIVANGGKLDNIEANTSQIQSNSAEVKTQIVANGGKLDNIDANTSHGNYLLEVGNYLTLEEDEKKGTLACSVRKDVSEVYGGADGTPLPLVSDKYGNLRVSLYERDLISTSYTEFVGTTTTQEGVIHDGDPNKCWDLTSVILGNETLDSSCKFDFWYEVEQQIRVIVQTVIVQAGSSYSINNYHHLAIPKGKNWMVTVSSLENDACVKAYVTSTFREFT